MDIRVLLFKIKAANYFLKVENDLSQKQIVEELNKRYKPDKTHHRKRFIGETSYSEYVNASEDGNQRGISQQTAWRLMKALEDYIKTDFSNTWDEGEQNFVSVHNLDKQRDINRLAGLFGTWEAFSWDSSNSNFLGIGHIHAFKILIKNVNDITCITKGTSFSEGKLSLLGTEKAVLIISHAQRNVFIIIPIGTSQVEDLKRKKRFTLGYLDSGNTNIKMGVAFMERSEKDFSDIQTNSHPVSFFEGKIDPIILRVLKDNQLVVG